MSNVKSSNERNVVRLLLDVKNNRYVVSTNDTNRVIVVRIEKIDNEVYENVFSTLFEHRRKNQQIVVTINRNFETTTNVTITNVLINNNFHV